MAITHVESFPAIGTVLTVSTTWNITIPASVQTDDILVFDVQTKDGNGMTVADNDTGGNTWTQKDIRVNGSLHTSQLFWKRATAGTAGKTLTASGGANNTTGALSVYRGCIATGDPIEAVLSEANASGDQTQAGITTLTAGAMVCLAGFHQDDRTPSNPSCTSPGALTIRSSSLNTTSATDGAAFHASAIKATAGATGNFTWTWSAAALGTSRAYALTPATGGPTPTRGRVSFAELETPNIPTRGRVSFAELETPQRITRGQVAWAELEVPQAVTRGRVAWAELETPNAPARGRLSWAELETPDVAGTPTRGRVSVAELELPQVLTRGRVSFAELEVPTRATRGWVSWLELETPSAITPTRGRLAWSEMEVPSLPARGWLSWAELQVPDVSAGEQLDDGDASSALMKWLRTVEVPRQENTLKRLRAHYSSQADLSTLVARFLRDRGRLN